MAGVAELGPIFAPLGSIHAPFGVGLPLLVGELSLAAVGLASVGLVLAHRLGVFHRLRTSAEQRAVERALTEPDSIDPSAIESLLDAVEALSAHADAEGTAPPPVDPDRLRRALNAVRETDPSAFADHADRLGAHLGHPSTPVRVAVSFTLAELARDHPERVWPHAAAFEVLLLDDDPTVRQNAVWAFRWLACEYAEALADVAPAIVDRFDDANPDARANVVTFCTEFCHDAPAVALSLPTIEGRLRVLATDRALDHEVQHDALVTADYVKSLRLDPTIEPADRSDDTDESTPDSGDEIALVLAEVDEGRDEDADEPVVRGTFAGVDVRVTDPPEGLGPLDRIRVEVVDCDPDDASAEAEFLEALD